MASNSGSQSVLCCGCAAKLIRPCQGFFRYFTLGHPIHPIQPAAPNHSEFISLGSKVHIRVIHVKSGDDAVLKEQYPCFNFNTKRLSLSEEYWFTRWNKPLKTGTCNCSFRRSLRYSAICDDKNNDLGVVQVKQNRLSNFDTPATRITNVETFVERLLQETLFEAFQEYLVSRSIKLTNNVKQGVSNSAYAISEDEVLLRKSINKNSCDNAAVLPADCVTVHAAQISQISAVQNDISNPKRVVCEHNNTANKINVSAI